MVGFYLATILHLTTASILLGVDTSAKSIETFAYPDESSLRAAWRPGPSSTPPRKTKNGALFELLFNEDRDRAYWDREVRLDLSKCTAIELDVTLDRPEAVRSLMLYFKSGDGWFVAGLPPRSAGRQRLVYPKSAFTVEGKPTGWHRVAQIRLSPWRGSAVRAQMEVHRLSTRSDTIHVIKSTVSSRNAAERAAAARAADRFSRWLGSVGVPHVVLSEDELSAEALADSRLIILPYNARPPGGHLDLYRKHAAKGGRFIVCFSDSEALADLMGVALGETISHREPGRLAGFAFDQPAKYRIPERVYQQSWSLRVTVPLEGRGRVIARWIGADGAVGPEPACLETDRGFWFTHILLDDDREGKERLAAGLVAHLMPEVWPAIAREASRRASALGGYGSFSEAREGLRRAAESHPSAERIRRWLSVAEKEKAVMDELHARGAYAEAVDSARRLGDALSRAYSAAQRPPTDEWVAVWDHDAVGWYPGNWDRTMAELKVAGINTLFVNTLWAGLAHYPSRFVPMSHTARRFGDQMQAALEAGRRHGISVHAWVVLWNVGNAPPEFLEKVRKEGRLQKDSGGGEVLWLNPAMPENRRHMLSLIEELARNYPVDGIHLDYVRFPSANACYSKASRAAFEKWAGRVMTPWPSAVRTGQGLDDFRRWRAGLITSFVRETKQSLRRLRPECVLSAAVWGGYPDTIASIGQDWGLWLREDLLDFVVPMNYAEETSRFSALLEKQLALPGAKGRVYPGIGVVASESQLRADQVVEQIATARRLGARGFALYKLSQTLKNETLPLLREGALRTLP